MTTAAAVGIAVYLALITAAFAWIVRCWRRECRLAARIERARTRSRLPQEMFLLRRGPDDLGPDHDWADKLLADIHQLPTTQGDR